MDPFRPGRAIETEESPFAPAAWAGLARAVRVDPLAPIAVALSGGADSVFLLHLIAAACPRPRLLGIHVEHGLRAEESLGDARFCQQLCAALAIECVVARVELARGGPSLEARAREARYASLCAAARRAGIDTIATAHHQDDRLETLLLRLVRGTDLGGLVGPESRLVLPAGARVRGRCKESLPGAGTEDGAGSITIVRPLLALRRDEVRRALVSRSIAWREDSSNGSSTFARNRVRHTLLPQLEALGGARALQSLRTFAAAALELDQHLAERTAHPIWSPHVLAGCGSSKTGLRRVLARAELTAVGAALVPRVLRRLLTEGTGISPSRALVLAIADEVLRGHRGRHTLPGGWSIVLQADQLALEPAPAGQASDIPGAQGRTSRASGRRGSDAAAAGMPLTVPGVVTLDDGRSISAERVDLAPGEAVPRLESSVELDDRALEHGLHVRLPRPGDRFHGLGAPGSKRLVRFLSDAGVASSDRARVPLVCHADEIVWVAGVRPCERWRVTPETRSRLRFVLHAPPAGRAGDFAAGRG